MIDPWRVNRLVNYPELWVLLQPAQRFAAFVNDVVIKDERDGFCPPVCCFQIFQQVYEQYRTFAAATHVADPACAAVQCSCQIVFFILARRHNALLLSTPLPVCTDFGIKMDIHLIFVKKPDVPCCTVPARCLSQPFFLPCAGHEYAA